MTSFKPGQRVRLKAPERGLAAGTHLSIDCAPPQGDWAHCLDDGAKLCVMRQGNLEAVGDQTPAPHPIAHPFQPPRPDVVYPIPLPAAPTPANDPVHRPHHYARYAIEPVEFVMKNQLPFAIGNVIKYVCRWDAKDGIQDLKKARRYLDMEIKRLEGDENFAK